MIRTPAGKGGERALAFFEEWVRAGKPTLAVFGKAQGISKSRVGGLLGKARVMLRHPSRADHPMRGHIDG